MRKEKNGKMDEKTNKQTMQIVDKVCEVPIVFRSKAITPEILLPAIMEYVNTMMGEKHGIWFEQFGSHISHLEEIERKTLIQLTQVNLSCPTTVRGKITGLRWAYTDNGPGKIYALLENGLFTHEGEQIVDIVGHITPRLFGTLCSAGESGNQYTNIRVVALDWIIDEECCKDENDECICV